MRGRDQERGKKRICLMGAARALLPEGAAPERERLPISDDAEAMELLALLVLGREFLPPDGVREDKEVRRDWLAATLYPGDWAQADKRQSARERVRHRLGKLDAALQIRTGLGENQRERTVIGLGWAGVWVDALALREAAAQPHSPDRQREIIALGDRPLLDGNTYPWLGTPQFQAVGAELDGYFLNALFRQADSWIVQREMANEAERFADADACRSQALPLLDKATARLACYGESLRQPEFAAVHIWEERFSGLRRRADYPLPAKPAPPVGLPPARLPRYIDSFVGRESEMNCLQSLLAAQRLVTLTGIGGCGKTRLALEAAAQVQDTGASAVRLVELASLTDPALLASQVVSALGLQAKAKHLETLIEYFQDKPTLLVLDNCEHLIDACAALAEALLQACPVLKILATSREPLNIGGEYLCPVLPLAVPDPDRLPTDSSDPVAALMEYDSVRLFLDRARLHQNFALKPEHLRAVATICASLDGVPLYLQLAAARVKMLTPQDIAEMLADRFGLLTDGRRTALPRHKTLRAVVDWSYDLLAEPEQALLCQLSVFEGGWTWDAAEAVGASGEMGRADVLERLASLVDKNLVTADMSVAPGRYGLLETLRQYAQDRLRERGEWAAAHDRHRAYFVGLAEAARPLLLGPDQKRWLDRLETEHANLRAALVWRADETGMRLACALQGFWWTRGYPEEGRRWLEREIAGVPDDVRADARIGAGRLAFTQGKYQEADRLFAESLALSAPRGDLRGAAKAYHNLGDAAMALGNYVKAEENYQAGLTRFRELKDSALIAGALASLAILDQNQSRYALAEEKHREALTLKRELADPEGIGACLMSLAELAFRQGRLADAQEFVEESLAFLLPLDSKQRTSMCLTILGRVSLAQGDTLKARQALYQALEISRTHGRPWDTVQALNYLATIASDENNLAEAEALLKESLALVRRMDAERVVTALQANLASILGRQGKHSEAQPLFAASLQKFREYQDTESLASGLEEYAILITAHAAQGQEERAVVLWGAAALAARIGFRRPANEDARYEQAVKTVRETLEPDAFADLWAQGQAMDWEQAVAFALEER